MASDLKHWRLNATVYDDRVEEIHFISDPARNVRRKEQTRVYKVEGLLGRGAFGEVRLEKNIEDGQVRAVKRIATMNGALSHGECEKELSALLEFSKRKYKEAAVFVEFLGWFANNNNIYLAMEYVHLGDLEKNVGCSKRIPENEARDIAEQILLGLEIMHAELFAHRDLKPQNVLVINGPPKWWVKLADFGMSKRLTESAVYHTRGGTQLYMAPELLNYLNSSTSRDYTNAVDIWAAGCIFFRLVTGVCPFPDGRSLMNYCDDKSLFPHDPLYDSGIKSEGAKFLRQLLVPYPYDRPSASQALRQKWIISGSSMEATSYDFARQPESGNKTVVLASTSEIGYNTVSHAGLQSSKPVPSSPRQALAPPSILPEASPLSIETTVRPLPKLSTIAPEQHLALHTQPESRESYTTTSTEKTTATAQNSEALTKLNPRSKRDIDSLVTSWASKQAGNSKEKSTGLEKLRAMVVGAKRINQDLIMKPGWRSYAFRVSRVTFSPDGSTIASASEYSTVRLFDVATGVECKSLKCYDWVDDISFSPGGKVVATAGREIILWDTGTGAIYRKLQANSGAVYGVAFSPDGQLLASCSVQKTVRLWSTTGKELYKLSGHNDSVKGIAFSPDGGLLASCSYDGSVIIWNTTTGTLINRLIDHTDGVWGVAFSPDGKVVASAAADTTIRLWDWESGGLARILRAHTNKVSSVAFSPDGKFIASGSWDKNVILWNANSGEVLRTFCGHKDRVNCVAFSPDSKAIVSGSDDKTFRLWEVS